MLPSTVNQKKFEDRLKKQEGDTTLLKEMATKIQKELYALTVEEMHLRSVLRMIRENAPSVVTTGSETMLPSLSGTGTAPTADESLQEVLNLKLLTVSQQVEEHDEEFDSDESEGDSEDDDEEDEECGVFVNSESDEEEDTEEEEGDDDPDTETDQVAEGENKILEEKAKR